MAFRNNPESATLEQKTDTTYNGADRDARLLLDEIFEARDCLNDLELPSQRASASLRYFGRLHLA
jgi:hypothetical protein